MTSLKNYSILLWRTISNQICTDAFTLHLITTQINVLKYQNTTQAFRSASVFIASSAQLIPVSLIPIKTRESSDDAMHRSFGAKMKANAFFLYLDSAAMEKGKMTHKH